MRVHSIFLHLMRSLSECPHFRFLSKRSNHLTPSLVRLRRSHVLGSPRCVRVRPEIMRLEAHSGMWPTLESGGITSPELVRPDVVGCMTRSPSCTKTCKGHAVVNSLLTPASEAVLSVPVGMQMPRTLCPCRTMRCA